MESLSGSQNEIRRQAVCLVEWAREQCVLLADDYADGLERQALETTEHEVYLRESDYRVIKRTFPGTFGRACGINGRLRNATQLYYLQRLELMNQVFGLDFRFEGVAFGSPRYACDENQSPYIVISQALVVANDEKSPYPSEQEIEDFMKLLGFVRMDDSLYRWFREADGIIVADTKELNFIKSPSGIVPIDLIIGKIAQ